MPDFFFPLLLFVLFYPVMAVEAGHADFTLAMRSKYDNLL
jgi:hypothetical protein